MAVYMSPHTTVNPISLVCNANIIFFLAESPESRLATYHGLIKEDAEELDEVELDIPILARDKSMLAGGKS